MLLSVPAGAARAARRTAGSATARATELAIETAASAIESFVRVLDLNGLLAGIDLDALLRRVDVQALIERIDLDSVLRRVDMNDLIARIDLDTLVEETDVGAVIARSTGSVASGAVDLVRRQGVGLDDVVSRLALRLRPRRLSTAPEGPPGLVASQGVT